MMLLDRRAGSGGGLRGGDGEVGISAWAGVGVHVYLGGVWDGNLNIPLASNDGKCVTVLMLAWDGPW